MSEQTSVMLFHPELTENNGSKMITGRLNLRLKDVRNAHWIYLMYLCECIHVYTTKFIQRNGSTLYLLPPPTTDGFPFSFFFFQRKTQLHLRFSRQTYISSYRLILRCEKKMSIFSIYSSGEYMIMYCKSVSAQSCDKKIFLIQGSKVHASCYP